MVHRYPSAVKAFYMKPDPQSPSWRSAWTCSRPRATAKSSAAANVSQDLDLLLERIKAHNLPQEAFEWYLDLRRYGSVPHGGFGMGIERVVSWICGLEHVRETIPYPADAEPVVSVMKVGLISLGCPKNLVDSEVMLGLARGAGHELTQDPSEAEVLVVNTCAFIDKAKKESIEAILDLARQKETGGVPTAHRHRMPRGALSRRAQSRDPGNRRRPRHGRGPADCAGDREARRIRCSGAV